MTVRTKIEPDQVELTEDQQESIYKEAMEEYENPGKQFDVEEDSDALKEEVKEEAEEAEVEEEKPVEDEKQDVEDDVNRDDQDQEKPKEHKEPKDKKSFEYEITDEDVKAYAIKHDLTESEAKEDLEKNYKTVKFYDNPANLARAFRKLQSQHESLKKATSEPSEQKKETTNVYSMERDQAVRAIESQISQKRDDVIANFQERYPAQSEMMTDEAILEKVRDEAIRLYEVKAERMTMEQSRQADEKRSELIESLDEFDKQFVVDIKSFLKNTNDAYILSDNFSMDEVLRWARGNKVKDLVKEAEERGYKRGREEATIVGEKAPVKQPSGSGKVAKVTSLNDEQKTRALQMFESVQGDDEQKFKLYRETYEEELRKNPNFMG